MDIGEPQLAFGFEDPEPVDLGEDEEYAEPWGIICRVCNARTKRATAEWQKANRACQGNGQALAAARFKVTGALTDKAESKALARMLELKLEADKVAQRFSKAEHEYTDAHNCRTICLSAYGLHTVHDPW